MVTDGQSVCPEQNPAYRPSARFRTEFHARGIDIGRGIMKTAIPARADQRGAGSRITNAETE